MVAVEHDHPRAGAEHRRPARHQRAQRLGEPLALDAEAHDGRLAPGDHQRVESLQIAWHADLARPRAERPQQLRVRLEIALKGEDADTAHPAQGTGYQPRGDSSCSASSFELSRLTIGWPRPVDAAAIRTGSW